MPRTDEAPPHRYVSQVIVRKKRMTPLKQRAVPSRAQVIAFAAALLVLAAVIVAGVISESGETGAANAPEKRATPTPISARSEVESSPTDSRDQESPVEGQTDLTFGQTAHFTSTAGSNEIPLEITVSAPVPFTPSKDARIIDQRAMRDEYRIQKSALQVESVYFTVTIENTSRSQVYDPDFLFSDVRQTGDDDHVSAVSDGPIEGFASLSGQKIRPGQSVTVKDGFSMKSSDAVQYELSIDGLAGTTFHFTR